MVCTLCIQDGLDAGADLGDTLLRRQIGEKDDHVGVAHGTGSTTQSKAADPVSGTLGWCQHSTGNDTWIIE